MDAEIAEQIAQAELRYALENRENREPRDGEDVVMSGLETTGQPDLNLLVTESDDDGGNEEEEEREEEEREQRRKEDRRTKAITEEERIKKQEQGALAKGEQIMTECTKALNEFTKE